MADLHISWDEYNKKTEQLASMVHKDGWEFNQVVCIAKGGMRVGDIMARIFDVPLAILSVESYRGDGVKNKRGSITFSRDLAKTSPNIGSKVLIVDDLADSGKTLQAFEDIYKYLRNITKVPKITTACLYCKKNSEFRPDHYSELVTSDDWLVFPWELNIIPLDHK